MKYRNPQPDQQNRSINHNTLWPHDDIRLFAYCTTLLSSLCRRIWNYYTSQILVNYIENTCTLSYPIIIIRSEVWTICHCLGLGPETMVCAVCICVFMGCNCVSIAWFQWRVNWTAIEATQKARIMGPTWGPAGHSCCIFVGPTNLAVRVEYGWDIPMYYVDVTKYAWCNIDADLTYSISHCNGNNDHIIKDSLIARFMGPTWGPSGADMTQVGPMLAPCTVLSWY